MKRKIALLLSLVMLTSMLATACGSKSGETTATTAAGTDTTAASTDATAAAASAQDLVVNVGPDPDTIDPALNSSVDGATLIIHAFEGLYTLDETGTPIPGQAESVAISDDGLTYTFTLRDGLKWTDGSDLTAEDFVYSWNRAISPDTASDYAYMFESIAGYDTGTLDVTATDAKTLVVKLNAVTPYFLELTAFPTFSPVKKDIVEADPEAWATKVDSYVGNGPYKMIEWVPGSYIKYEKNPNYWNVAALGPDTIKFVLMEDDVSILNAFVNGDILFADQMPNDEITAWQDKAEFHKAGQLGTYYVSYNTTAAPLDNILVREALTLAVDRDYICVNIGKSGQEPAGAYVPTGLTDADATKEYRTVGGDYYDPTAAGNAANLQKAKDLLAEAGYPNGEGLPTLEYLYNEGTGHQQIGEALQSMWAAIGVNVDLVSQDWATFLNSRKNGDYEIARNGWLADYNDPITFLDMWITGGGNNDAQWSNADYDALISQIKSSSDQTERFKLMHEAEDILFKEWVLCPIYYYVDIYLQSTNLTGVWSSPLGYKYFMYAKIAE